MQDKKIFPFVIYIIHACASKWNKLPSDVYKILESKECIEKFLVSNYDVLHTQSTAFIVEDIEEYLNNRGISI